MIAITMPGGSHRPRGGYAWDDDIPPAIGSEPPGEATSTTTDRQEPRTAVEDARAARGATPERWQARHFEVASRVAVLEEAIARVTRATDPARRSRSWTHLRRLTGGFGAVRDSLYEVTRAAERCAHELEGAGQPYVLYVECVFWWFADVLRDLERVASTGEPLDAVAESSSEYVLARILPLQSACADAPFEPSVAALRAACEALHEDVLWIDWHLKER